MPVFQVSTKSRKGASGTRPRLPRSKPKMQPKLGQLVEHDRDGGGERTEAPEPAHERGVLTELRPETPKNQPFIAALSFSTVISGSRAASMMAASRAVNPSIAFIISSTLSDGTTTAPC